MLGGLDQVITMQVVVRIPDNFLTSRERDSRAITMETVERFVETEHRKLRLKLSTPYLLPGTPVLTIEEASTKESQI